MAPFQLIAFDADDTLWHNETYYRASKARLVELLAPYATAEQVTEHLEAIEMRNIAPFGYGIKAFVLSMIETAVDPSGERLHGSDVRQIINFGREMLATRLPLLEGVEPVLAALAEQYPLMVVTKGDLLDQEAKLANSGLEQYFQYVEIVSNKTMDTYQRILERRQVPPEAFVMVGNSLKSDILPVVQIGGWGVYIPYEHTWAHEQAIDQEIDPARFVELASIDLLPGWLAEKE